MRTSGFEGVNCEISHWIGGPTLIGEGNERE